VQDLVESVSQNNLRYGLYISDSFFRQQGGTFAATHYSAKAPVEIYSIISPNNTYKLVIQVL
jgi:hypothetical protein